MKSDSPETPKMEYVCQNPDCGRSFTRDVRPKARRHFRVYCSRTCFIAHDRDPAERFLKYVPVAEEHECWEWTGSKTGRPGFQYGSFYCGDTPEGKRIHTAAHRFAYQLQVGPIPDGLCVLHRCDNPMCVNPNHLFLGTHKDNMEDRQRKGRQAKGERHGRHKWNRELIDAALAEVNGGKALATVAKHFGIPRWTLRTYAHR